MMKSTEDAMVAEYLKADGTRCPFCLESDLDGEGVEIEGGFAFQRIHCGGCNGSWEDKYRLIDMVNIHAPEDETVAHVPAE